MDFSFSDQFSTFSLMCGIFHIDLNDSIDLKLEVLLEDGLEGEHVVVSVNYCEPNGY